MDVRHAGLDELAELELLAALADLERAQFACPLVDVLEQVSMDRAQMGKVGGATRDAATAAQHDESALLLIEEDWIVGPELVSQDRCARVVGSAHRAGAGLRARM